MKNEHYLQFPHLSLSGYDLRTYGIIQTLYKFCHKEVLIAINSIGYYINGKVKLSRNFHYYIKESLERLYKAGLISKLEDSYIYDPAFKFNHYETCSIEVFDKLIDKPELLLHYLSIKRGRIYSFEINGRDQVICKKSIEAFSLEEHTSCSSIMRYNSELEKMKLIYIGHGKFDGNSCECNIYSLYEDREYVDAYVGELNNKVCSAADKDRSISQRYNRYKKAPEKYSQEQIEQLHKDVIEYNERMRRRGEIQPDYLNKVKDESIFFSAGVD